MQLSNREYAALINEATDKIMEEGTMDEAFLNRWFSHWHKNNPQEALNEKDRFIQWAQSNPNDSKYYYNYWLQKYPAYAENLKAAFGSLFGDNAAVGGDQNTWANNPGQALKELIAATKWPENKVRHYVSMINGKGQSAARGGQGGQGGYRGTKSDAGTGVITPSQDTTPSKPAPQATTTTKEPLTSTEPVVATEPVAKTSREINQEKLAADKEVRSNYRDGMKQINADARQARQDSRAAAKQERQDLRAAKKAGLENNRAQRAYERSVAGKPLTKKNQARAEEYKTANNLEEQKLRSIIRGIIKDVM